MQKNKNKNVGDRVIKDYVRIAAYTQERHCICMVLDATDPSAGDF